MANPKDKDSTDKKSILSKLRIMRIALATLLGLLLATGIVVWEIGKNEGRRLELRHEAIEPPTAGSIGGSFTLSNQDGKTVKDTDFRGKYMLVYFGYTYCPDLCPTGLQAMAHAMDQLGPDAKKVQSLFVTVDPKRDTPAVLKEYVASFHPDIMGLTGTPEQIAAVAKEYKVYYAKADDVGEGGDYIMDHSTLIYVMDPQGKFLTTFPEDMDPAGMVDALHAIWTNKPLPAATQKPGKIGP